MIIQQTTTLIFQYPQDYMQEQEWCKTKDDRWIHKGTDTLGAVYENQISYSIGATADRKTEPIDKDINVRSKTEPNLILPERMERGERFEVGETIVVMNRDDYYDLLCKSWKDESHTDTHDEAIKAMATLIKAKDEPQTEREGE